MEVPPDGTIFPLQIEKKCFFFKQEPRFSGCNAICNKLCGRGGIKQDVENYDYFLHHYNKYSLSARNFLAPQLSELIRSLHQQAMLEKQIQQASQE